MRYFIAYLLAFLMFLCISGTIFLAYSTFKGSIGAWICLYVSFWGGMGGPLSLMIGDKEKT